RVLRGLRVFGEQILEVEPAVGAWVDLDLQRLGGLHRGGKFLRQGDDPAGALAHAVVDLYRLDETRDPSGLGIVHALHFRGVARARNDERAIHHVRPEHIDAILRLAVGFGRDVQRRNRLADDLVLPRLFDLDRLEVFRIGELAVDLHLLNDFAVADGAVGD